MNKWHDHLMGVAKKVVDLKLRYNPDGEITFENIMETKMDECVVHLGDGGSWSVEFGMFVDGGVNIRHDGCIELTIEHNPKKSMYLATKLANDFLTKLKEVTDKIPDKEADDIKNKRIRELKTELASLESL